MGNRDTENFEKSKGIWTSYAGIFGNRRDISCKSISEDRERADKKADKKPIKKPIKKADKKLLYLQRQREVLSYIQVHGSISNKEARELLGLAESTTKRFLKQMADEGILKEQGEKKIQGISEKYLKREIPPDS